MTICYKLTAQDGTTRNNVLWGPGVTHEIGVDLPDSSRTGLCSSAWLHCYDDPYLGLIRNDKDAGFANPRIWLAEGEGGTIDGLGLKRGYKRLTTVREITDQIVISPTQRTAFGILCALEVYQEKNWVDWAEKWLSGEDRTLASSSSSYASSYASSSASASAYASAYAYAAAAAAYAAPLDFPMLIAWALTFGEE